VEKIQRIGENRGSRILFWILVLFALIFAAGMVENMAKAETFNITLSNQFNETEAGFHHLLIAECVDSTGVSHEDNVTFTITGVAFTYSASSEYYYGTVAQTTPQTIEYGVLAVFADSENVTSTATIIRNCTVTWTTNTLDRMEQEVQNGNWIAAILNEGIFIVGSIATNTFITGTFSIGVYQIAGLYGLMIVWLLGWGIFASQVHGNAQKLSLLIFALSAGAMVAKMFLDRRTTG
jgi:hypothetical protein